MLLSTRKPVLSLVARLPCASLGSSPTAILVALTLTVTVRLLPVSRNGSKLLNPLLVKYCSTPESTHREYFATPFAHTEVWKRCCSWSHGTQVRQEIYGLFVTASPESETRNVDKDTEMDEKEVLAVALCGAASHHGSTRTARDKSVIMQAAQLLQSRRVEVCPARLLNSLSALPCLEGVWLCSDLQLICRRSGSNC